MTADRGERIGVSSMMIDLSWKQTRACLEYLVALHDLDREASSIPRARELKGMFDYNN